MLTENEIQSVTSLGPNERYRYTIKRIADYEIIWVIGDDQGLRTYSDDSGNFVYPIWPFEEFALLCCNNEFDDCRPEAIELRSFIEKYLPDFKQSIYKIAIFPLNSDKGVVICVEDFEQGLNSELENY